MEDTLLGGRKFSVPSLKAQEKRKTMISILSAVIELSSGDFQSIKITFKGITKRKVT